MRSGAAQAVLQAMAGATALAWRGSWPAPDNWDGVVQQGRRTWVAYTAYRDGIEVYEMGWTG
jgi:hypothetical protein